MKILVIEDDEQTAAQLSRLLAAHNYQVATAQNGQTGLELAKTSPYDLIVLDIVMPDLDGLSVCTQLRAQGYQMPILIVTARDSRDERIQGLETGADDYVIKPFDEVELLARVRALLRRGAGIAGTVLSWENLRLNLNSREVTYQETLLRLTPKEYGLLELFLRNPRRIFSRSTIIDRVWTIGESPGEEAVRTQIMGLRQKLKAAGMVTDCIETVYGLGYRLKQDPMQEESVAPINSPLSQKVSTSTSSVSGISQPALGRPTISPPMDPEIQRVIEQSWIAFQPQLQQILQQFEQVLQLLQSNSLTDEQRRSAKFIAHRLVGSLGSLGAPQGSAIARQIEATLELETQDAAESATQLGKQIQQLRYETQQRSQQFPSLPDPPRLSPTRILLVDDPEFARQIQQAGLSFGFQVDVAASFSEAKAALSTQEPDLVALDLTVPDLNEDSFSFLESLSEQYPSLPVIVMTGHNRLSDRLMAARFGSRAFVQKPISAEQLIETVIQTLQPVQPEQVYLLVVDDDPVILDHISSLLQPWGIEVITLQEPAHFWDILESVVPDLLILDIEMPDISGADLCQIVRNDSYWSDIPILMLSAHRDTETICQLFALGADDYVSKPIVEPELVARVLNRLERASTRNRPARAHNRTYVNCPRSNSSPFPESSS